MVLTNRLGQTSTNISFFYARTLKPNYIYICRIELIAWDSDHAA